MFVGCLVVGRTDSQGEGREFPAPGWYSVLGDGVVRGRGNAYARPCIVTHATFWAPHLLFAVCPDRYYVHQTQASKHCRNVLDLCLAFSEVLVRAPEWESGALEGRSHSATLWANQTSHLTSLYHSAWKPSPVKPMFSNCVSHGILYYLSFK